MGTRTCILSLVTNPECSRIIGELTSQQRLSYNAAVNILNREPDIPKRAPQRHSHGLNKRITAWRQASPERATAPYHIHQQGSEAAWDANQRLIEHREARLTRIKRAVDLGKEPHPADQRPHRRTLAHRTRKHGTQTLTIRGAQFIQRRGPYSFTITGVDHVLRTRDPLPDRILALQFVEIPDRRSSVNAPLSARRYQLHVAADWKDPDPQELADAPLERYDGMDDGIASHWTFSDGEQFIFQEPYPHRQPAQEKRTQQGKERGSKRRARHVRQCKTRSRRRQAEKRRQFNHHAIAHLERVQPVAVCVEIKNVQNLIRSARGKGRRRKARLNKALADVGLTGNQRILANQCRKRGIQVIPIPAPGTSQTCPRCGYRHRKNRESQASFRCRQCHWSGNADHSAAQIIRNRGFVRTTERVHGRTPFVEEAPTGWQEQPSRQGQQYLLPMAQNTAKPKRTATMLPESGRKQPGSGTRGRTIQIRGKEPTVATGDGGPSETGHAQGVQTRLL